MTTLLTGFNRFGDLEVNPTHLIVETLAQNTELSAAVNLVAEVLPTEFGRAGNRIKQLIRQFRPRTVICLGVGVGFEAIHLERVALNLNDADLPDNAGVSRKGTMIVPDGPQAYLSTLPIEKLCDLLKQQGIQAVISNHAGTFVCNHVFYVARHEIECLGIRSACGFIHVPQISESTLATTQPQPGMPLRVMVEAVECCLVALEAVT